MSYSVNRIFCNLDNLAREAAIAANAQRASTDIRLLAQQRAGGGRVSVGGAYTGAADSVIDVEVVSGSGGELTASAPVIRGVGNGALAVASIEPAAVAETLTVSLLNPGTNPEPALLEFFGAVLAARAPGADSNALSLSVVRNLVATPMQYATLESITAGTAQFDGPQWDWGQPPATDAGIPPGAIRIQFDGFPTVHRSWKVWEDGRFVYRIDPAATYPIPADVRIIEVSGDYTLTLTDGVVSEVYTAVTIYDFLTQIDARSALAAVRGAVAQDRAPGGMAVTDIPLRTDAHALPATGGQVEVVSVDPAAPTQNLTLEYLGAGAGSWSVRGSVSGTLPVAATGVLYTHGPVSFRIPTPASTAAGARIAAVLSLVAREEGEFPPAVCFKPIVLGAAATDKSATFTYTRRPPADCVCENLPPLHLSMSCLGLEENMAAYPPAYMDRVKDIYAWREAFIRANTEARAAGTYVIPGTPGTPGTDPSTGELIYQLYGSASYTEQGFHVAVAFEVLQDFDSSAVAAAQIALTGQTIPASTARGATVTLAGYSVKVLSINATTGAGSLTLGGVITATHQDADLPEPSIRQYVTGVDSGSPGTPGTPSQTINTTAGFLAYTLDLDWMEAVIPIMLGALVEIYEEAPALAMWDDLWTEVQADLTALNATKNDLPELETDRNTRYLDRYTATVDNILLEAGLVPKSSAGSNAGACWRDYPDATHWWVDESGEYLPAFTNKPYVSASRDAEGNIFSTREFGIGIVTPCEIRLKEGDRITITIRGTGLSGYREGDKITIPVVAAQSAPFVGGSDGDPTQEWTVRGSVSGALPDWLYDPTDPDPYLDGPAVLTLSPGGIPWEVGDSISVALEGGTLRWRRDGGAWTTGNLFGVVHDAGDGLTLAATPGAAPSFVSGDAWQYRAVATHGLSRLRQPRIGEAYAWDGAAVTLDVDLGAVQPLEAVLLALHSLPSGVSILVTGGDADADDWSTTPAWHPSAVLAMLPSGTTARYLRVSITGAGAGAAIGWLWAGEGWRPSVGASDLTLRRQYGLARGQGLNPAALYRGRGMGGAWRWSVTDNRPLLGTDADELLALIDHTAEQGMEPVCIVPDVRDPARAAIAIIDTDEVLFTEHNNWQSSALARLAVSVDLPFRAVLA